METTTEEKKIITDKIWYKKIWKAIWGNSALTGLLIGVVTTVCIFVYNNIDPPAVKAQVEEIKTTIVTHIKQEDSNNTSRTAAIEVLKTNQINTDKKIDDLKSDNKESFTEINRRLDALFQQRNSQFNNSSISFIKQGNKNN